MTNANTRCYLEIIKDYKIYLYLIKAFLLLEIKII